MQAVLREILEKRRSGLLPMLLRAALFPLGCIMGCIGLLRRRLYASNWLMRHRSPVAVVSVGNITAGGTGKTPFVIMVCRLLKSMGRRPAILLRGYKSQNPDESDEAMLYRRLCPEFGVFAGGDRVASSYRAIAAGYDTLVLDDGFQHIKLMRDFDIVLLDATCPFGGGMPLPAGLLREFAGVLKKADLLCLTRTDQVSAGTTELVRENISEYCDDKLILQSVHRPVSLIKLSGDDLGLEALVGAKVVALSGIGRPDSFVSTLRDLGAEVIDSLAFADHAAFTEKMVGDKLRKYNSSYLVVVTEKDAVKLEPVLPDSLKNQIAVLGVEMRISNMPQLRERLAEALRDAPRV